jgi:hypothetical protein
MMVFKLDVSDQVVVQDYRRVRADHAEFTDGVFMIDKTDNTASPSQIPVGFRAAGARPPHRALGYAPLALSTEFCTGREVESFRKLRGPCFYTLGLASAGHPERPEHSEMLPEPAEVLPSTSA